MFQRIKDWIKRPFQTKRNAQAQQETFIMPDSPENVTEAAKQKIATALKDCLTDKTIRCHLEIETVNQNDKIIRFDFAKDRYDWSWLGNLLALIVFCVAISVIVIEIQSIRKYAILIEQIKDNGIFVSLPNEHTFSAQVIVPEKKTDPVELKTKEYHGQFEDFPHFKSGK